MRPVHLIESPQEVLGSLVHIISPGVVWEVISQRRPCQLLLEYINLVEEQNDARSHEPARVDHRVEQQQAFHHAVLTTTS